jgi:hypothetical protein
MSYNSFSAMQRDFVAHFTEIALSRITYAPGAILRPGSIGDIVCCSFNKKKKKTASAGIKR